MYTTFVIIFIYHIFDVNPQLSTLYVLYFIYLFCPWDKIQLVFVTLPPVPNSPNELCKFSKCTKSSSQTYVIVVSITLLLGNYQLACWF